MRKSLFPFVPFLLLTLPIMEIFVFILLGGQIGVLNTLLGIVLTALIGTILLRQQGFALLAKAQSQMDQGKLPGKELAHGVMLLAAGLLLLTPGFVTDSVGFLLLVPTIRDEIFAFFKKRVTLTGFSGQQGSFSKAEFYHHQSGPGFSSSGPHSSQGQQRPSPSARNGASIIDLDEEDFTEVADHKALGGSPDPSSPWHDKEK